MNQRLRVGVVGAGAMGASHVGTLAAGVPAAQVTRVFDLDTARAKDVASAAGGEAAESADALIADPEVDAIVIASPDFTHADLAIAAIEAGKHVMCEKPLAVTADDARRVVDAEVAAGRRFVQVGFNRRFDPGFQDLKSSIIDGSLGEVRVLHGIHRNASNATSTDDAGLVTGSMIHEFDTFRWLLDGEIIGIRVESPVTEGFRDPQVATLWTDGGQMITAEVFVNAGYGYDVRVEVVGTGGSASLEPRTPVIRRISGQGGSAIGSDFVAHFIESYRLELAAWADAALRGDVVGASAWDGYVANLVAGAGVAALGSGARETVDVPERPELYG
ncbi:Gfo/Idh/MocA family oxidoreductase [Aeromicrobium wangtongii]|uniref:Gfo/Idh/MocA family oxidoreductase n=1 Tax=Aeromicrobium wangtongii TaxID=2969247 RepID=A0ABY5M9E1_9ACTN|nr:Gfo/Idh/MocA family oxidoreductase [Aeromicrobium wangtongii]MCD9197253.1 Gfo/Idh/MocA family oxidoreductase [Aeromicrobium wangtongii]UUP14749.1 Gfo/Idh/MocA family oxidoreductase [Aeromicrobium wangtongii]